MVFGSRFGGAAGAAVALLGLIGPPLVIVTVLGVLYERYGDIDSLGRILAGIATAASGLLSRRSRRWRRPCSPSVGTRRRRSQSSRSRRCHHALAAALRVRRPGAGGHRARLGQAVRPVTPR